MEFTFTCVAANSTCKTKKKEHFQKANIPKEISWKSNTIHINEGHDPLSKLHTIMHGDTLPLVQGKEVPIDWACKRFQDLSICAAKTENTVDDKEIIHPAGKIDKVITSLGRLIVQPLSTDRLLCLGSPLFLERFDTQSSDIRNYLLGHIDDIFGSIQNPLYSVDINHNTCSFNIGEEVYYISNNSSTRFIYIQSVADETTQSVRHEVKTKKF